MFGRKKQANNLPKSPTPDLSPVLSSNFAQEVLDLEGELDFSCNMIIVQRLMHLYSQAVEYFESIKDPKYLHYQERMQNLLTRKDVLLAIKNPEPVNRTSMTPTPESFKRKVEHRQKIRAKQADVHLNRNIKTERNAEQTIITHSTSNSQISNKLKENLKLQSEALNQRLLDRIKSKSPSPTKMFKKSSTFINQIPNYDDSSPVNKESDKSGGFSKKTPLELFEEEVEIIMENFVEERVAVKTRIMESYSEQLKEIEKMGDSPIINEVKTRMKKVMEEETAVAIQGLENKRKGEISAARIKLLNDS